MVIYIYKNLHVVSWCFTFARDFMKISQMVFNLLSRHEYMVEMAMCNVQRQSYDSCVLHFVSWCFIFCEVLWKYHKWYQSYWATPVHGRNGFFQYLWCSNGNNSKSRLTRVMVLMFCTSSHGALHLWEISWKYLVFNVQSRQECMGNDYVHCSKDNNSWKYHKWHQLWSGHQYMVEMAIFNIYNVQRAVTPKVGQPELWFLCSACRLMVLYICERFHENILNSFQLTERTGLHDGNYFVQCSKGNNSQSRQSELQFMRSAHPLIMLYTCAKFHKNITNGIRVMEQTRVHGRNGYVKCSKGNNSVSRQTRE